MPQWKFPTKKYYNNDINEGSMEIKIADSGGSQTITNGNKLYFYGDINNENTLSWNKQLEDVSKNLKVLQIMYDLHQPPPLYIYIQSDGGEIFPALSTLGRISSIKESGIEVYTVVEGFVASAATFISVSGTFRSIRRQSCMMIHQLSGEAWGTYAELKDEQNNYEMLMDKIKEVYREYTTINSDYLDEILSHDIYLNSDECLELGLVDKIL